MGKFELVRFETADELATTVARQWLDQLSGTQSCAFSGGRIAEKFFDALRDSGQPLESVHFFWADERCVPPDHPDSNYRLMHTRLLKPSNISETRVHRIKGELEPELAAREASVEFADVMRSTRPALDFVFLGMGEDGHIASIFPGDPLKESSAQYYRPVVAPKPPPRRITLAMHAMVAARNVWVLASGPGKDEALGKSLRENPGTPLGRLLERRDFTNVFTDIPGK